MAYTTDRTWVAGEVVTAAYLNTYLRDNMKWLSTDKPMVRAYRTTTQTIPNATYTGIQMNIEIFDNADIHSTTTNTDRFTVPSGAGGKWLVGSGVEWTYSSIGVYRVAAVTVDGGFEYQNSSPTVGSTSVSPVSTFGLVSAASAAVIRPSVYQDSGGDLTTLGSGSKQTGGWAVWIGI